MVISRAIFFKMLVLMGLISLLVIKHFPIKKLPPFDNVQFWEAVAIVGGIVYLMGADAERKEPVKVTGVVVGLGQTVSLLTTDGVVEIPMASVIEATRPDRV